MLKIRLSRRGRIHRPYYAIVVADSAAPRDGKFKEKLGTYDPMAVLRDVNVKGDRILFWLFKGAQLSPAVRHLCSAGGLLLVKHLIEGLKRGCIDKKVAHKRLGNWQKMIDKRKKPRLNFVSSAPLPDLIQGTEEVPLRVTNSGRKGNSKNKKA